MAERHDDPEVLGGILDHSPYVVMLVDGLGVIRWVNAAVERHLGLGVDEVIDTNVLDYIDPTFDASALASIGDAMNAEGLRLPTYFRTVLPDGSAAIFEVWANAQMHDPVLGGLVVYLRPWDERMLIDRALEAMIGGEPLALTLDLLVQSMAFETLEADGALLHHPGDGGFALAVTSGRLSEALTDHLQGPGPWTEARVTGAPATTSVDELPVALADAARAAGYLACWAWPIQDDGGGVAGSVVAWRRADQTEVDHSRRQMMDRLARVAGLAISRAHLVSNLHHAATHDPLTGLANRARFYQALDEMTGAAGTAARPAGTVGDNGDGHGHGLDAHPMLAVLYLDLDGFKAINDRLGHAAGDTVLQAVARRLEAVARRGDLVARLGGDEFALLCPRVGAADELDQLAGRMAEAVRRPVQVGEEYVSVGVSTGIAVRDPRTCTPDELVESADAALYRVKFGAKGGWVIAGSPR